MADLSKLSTEDLLALQSGDISKVSTEGLQMLQNQQSIESFNAADYDKPMQPTFGFEGPAKTARQGMEALGALVGSGGDIQQASGIAQGEEAKTTGGKIGKFIGGMASPVEVGMAAFGGEVLKPAAQLAKPAIKSLFSPALKTAGKNLGDALEKAGVAISDEIPLLKSGKAIQNFSDELKPVREATVESLAKVKDPITLNRLQTKIGDILDYLKVAKQGSQPKLLVPKGTIARLSKTKDILIKALKVAKPELVEPFEQYAASAQRANTIKGLGKLAKKAAIPTAILGGLGYGLSK